MNRFPAPNVAYITRIRERIEARLGLATGDRSHIDLTAALAHEDLPSLADQLASTPTHVDAWQRIIDRLVVRETYFGRNPAQLNLLRDLLRATSPASPPRIWSVGCASGEEAYSAGIALRPAYPGVEITGTELSHDLIQAAEHGVYRRWSLRGSDPAFVETYFEETADGYRLRDAARRGVSFQQGNLLETSESGWADAILCRHVLLYFTPQARERGLARLWDALKPGGWLLLGPTEAIEGGGLPWELHRTGDVLAYRRPLPDPQNPTKPSPSHKTSTTPIATIYDAAVTAFREKETDEARILLEHVLNETAGHISARLLLAALTANEGDHATALLLLDAATTQEPLNADAYYLIGLVRLETDPETDLAARAFTAALYADSAHPLAAHALGLLRASAGDADGARKLWERATTVVDDLPPDAPVRDYAPGTAADLADALARLLS